MGTSPGALVAGGITHRIHSTSAVLAGVELRVGSGEILALVGPNGGGKSTLLSLLAGLTRPDEGTVTWRGRSTADLAREAAGTVGLVTPLPGLYPELTGRENLEWFAGLSGVDVGGLPGLAARLGVDGVLDQRVRTLSSGQAQKLSLIRALLASPEVLLLDEPTANLDPLAASQLHREIRAHAEGGGAVVFCTHDLDAVARLATQVVVLNQTVRVSRPVPKGQPDVLLEWFSEAV